MSICQDAGFIHLLFFFLIIFPSLHIHLTKKIFRVKGKKSQAFVRSSSVSFRCQSRLLWIRSHVVCRFIVKPSHTLLYTHTYLMRLQSCVADLFHHILERLHCFLLILMISTGATSYHINISKIIYHFAKVWQTKHSKRFDKQYIGVDTGRFQDRLCLRFALTQQAAFLLTEAVEGKSFIAAIMQAITGTYIIYRFYYMRK